MQNRKKTNESNGPVKVLVTTPSFDGGSWILTKNLMGGLRSSDSSFEIMVVGMGKVHHKPEFRFVSIPYPSFNRWGHITAKNPVFALIWHMPLFIVSFILSLIFRPDIIVSNGFVALLGVIWEKARKSRFVVIHQVHGIISSSGKLTRSTIQALGRILDLVIVNSDDCLNEIETIYPGKKIIKIEIFADDVFFEGDISKHMSDSLVVSYVGRLDDGKLCGLLIQLAKKHMNNQRFKFIFAGEGQLEPEIERMERTGSNIKYYGYITDRLTLRELYRMSDVVWSYADENYISLPAIEALACGRPIVVPGISAMTHKPINRKLVPEGIGFIVHPYNLQSAESTINKIRACGITDVDRKNCRDHARMKYSSRNLKEAVLGIARLIPK